MPSDLETFRHDLLQSIKQMRSGQGARTTQVAVPAAAAARARTGLSRQAFAQLLGVSARTLQGTGALTRRPLRAAHRFFGQRAG